MKHVLLFAFLSGSIAQNFDWDEERQSYNDQLLQLLGLQQPDISGMRRGGSG